MVRRPQPGDRFEPRGQHRAAFERAGGQDEASLEERAACLVPPDSGKVQPAEAFWYGFRTME